MNKELVLKEQAEVANVRDVEESGQIARVQAEVQASFVIAVKRPRDETTARIKLAKSIERLSFAEDSFYSFPRANREIFGPSINFAREFARLWGNIRYGYRVIHDTEENRTIEGFAWDVETNTYTTSQATFKKQIQRKDAKTGITRWVTPDERDLRELTEKHASIQVRNCVLRLAPRDIVDDMVEQARKVVKVGISKKPIEELRVEIVQNFEKIGIYQPKLEEYLGKPVNEITPDEILELQGALKSIRDGVVSREEYFGEGTTKKKEDTQQPGEMTLDKVMNGENTTEPPAEEKRKPGRPPKEMPADEGKPLNYADYVDEKGSRIKESTESKVCAGKECSSVGRKILCGKVTGLCISCLRKASGKFNI